MSGTGRDGDTFGSHLEDLRATYSVAGVEASMVVDVQRKVGVALRTEKVIWRAHGGNWYN